MIRLLNENHFTGCQTKRKIRELASKKQKKPGRLELVFLVVPIVGPITSVRILS